MKNTAAGVPFILICVLLDILGIGLIIPVLPQLVGDLAGSQSAQAWWLGAMLVAYGLMQFCFAPTLGALSDRYGRRPVLLLGIFGLGIMFLVPALSQSLPVILFSRILGGMFAGNIAVAQASDQEHGYPANDLCLVCVHKEKRNVFATEEQDHKGDQGICNTDHACCF